LDLHRGLEGVEPGRSYVIEPISVKPQVKKGWACTEGWRERAREELRDRTNLSEAPGKEGLDLQRELEGVEPGRSYVTEPRTNLSETPGKEGLDLHRGLEGKIQVI
jgi:hypothetical protein